MKHIQGFFMVKEFRSVKIVTMSAEAGIPLTHQPMDTPHKELCGLLLESQHHHSLESSFDQNLWPFSVFLRRPNTKLGFSF
jgi:hypothetical protein